MTTFNSAIQNQEARTQNGMKARQSSANANTDLFFKIGASRGKDIIPQFVAAFVESPDLAVRITQWARDIRGGAGERQLFKDILSYLEKSQPAMAMRLQAKVAEIGRWDDLLIDYCNTSVRMNGYRLIKEALDAGNGLCAKWMPRKGQYAIELRNYLGFSRQPKKYRKLLVGLTEVVETKMCENKWDEINFSHVPSLASARYKSAFYAKAEAKFTAYVEALSSGDKSVKVNAGAVYPYDVLKGVKVGSYFNRGGIDMSQVELDHVIAQWNALPNFLDDADVFPLVDVSASMEQPVSGNGAMQCMDVAISLGLYCADKNTGKFADSFMTFSESPDIVNLRGNIVEKLSQMKCSDWGYNTDLHKAFDGILNMAINGNVAASEMPKILLIMSDMQFDECIEYDDSASQMIARKFAESGYDMPKVVFWNMASYDNVPVKFDQAGTALVSGYSPAIMKAVLSANFEDFTPESIMREAVCIERYDF